MSDILESARAGAQKIYETPIIDILKFATSAVAAAALYFGAVSPVVQPLYDDYLGNNAFFRYHLERTVAACTLWIGFCVPYVALYSIPKIPGTPDIVDRVLHGSAKGFVENLTGLAAALRGH